MSLQSALNLLPNLVTSSPWDEVAIEKSLKFKDSGKIEDLDNYIDGFISVGNKMMSAEEKIEKLREISFKWVSIPMGNYYNDLWYGLNNKTVPALKSEIAAGGCMLISIYDLVTLINVQRSKGYSIMVNAVAKPAVVKATETLELQIRNITVNG